MIKKGKIVDYQVNWKGREYDTVVFAAPINVKQSSGVLDEYLMAVIVIRAQKHNKQRFYVHEAVAIKKEDLLFKTGIDSKRNKETGNSSSFIYSILQKVVNYNEVEENNDKKYSINVDSLGNELSSEQQEYFRKTIGRKWSIVQRTGKMLEGDLPKRALNMVQEWTEQNKDELLEIWETQKFKELPPLE